MYFLVNLENPVVLWLLCNAGSIALRSLGEREEEAQTGFRLGFSSPYSSSRFWKRSSCPLSGSSVNDQASRGSA